MPTNRPLQTGILLALISVFLSAQKPPESTQPGQDIESYATEKHRLEAEINALRVHILNYTELYKKNPARKQATEIAAWITAAAEHYDNVTPWEVLEICKRESSLMPRQGAVGEIGPGQLNKTAAAYAVKELKTTKDAISGQSALSYQAVALWLSHEKKSCPAYPYGQYHTGKCRDCFYDRDVKRLLMKGESHEGKSIDS